MKKVIVGYDSWKRPIVKYVEDTSDRIPEQLSFNFKPREATREEWDEWQEKELDWWGEIQLPLVFIMALVQLGALGFMFTTFYIISLGLGK